MRPPRRLRTIFLWPLAFALLTLAGLLAALVGDGAWDVASWTLLTPAAALCLFKLLRA